MHERACAHEHTFAADQDGVRSDAVWGRIGSGLKNGQG